jgi:hypothetical protein
MSSKGHNTINSTAKQLMRKHSMTRIGSAYMMKDSSGNQVVIRRSGSGWVALSHPGWRNAVPYKTLTEAVEAVAA